MPTTEERALELARIRNGMLRQEYFLMHRRSAASEKKAAVLLEHFQWLVAMEKADRIVFTGARFNRAGVQDEGLTLLRAENWEDAERVAATDPFVLCGAVTFYIERFLLGAGRVSVSIDLSDSTVRFL